MKLLISTLFFSLFLSSTIQAQFVTGSAPAQDGTISTSEYYSSTSSPWFMCWDNTFLYIALTGGGANEPGIVYFDFNANTAANGGVALGTNGSTTGKGDYGVTPNLPFVSNSRIFFVTNLNGSSGLYAEVNTNTGSGWGSPTAVTSGLGASSGTNREFKISWAQLQGGSGSRPAAFNWLGTATSTSGFIYNAFPVVNYVGNSTTTPTYYFYQSVTNTNSGTASNPFSSNFISLSNYNTSFDYTSSLPATLYDISIGKTGSSGALNIKSSITVKGNIGVRNGIVAVTGGSGRTINMNGTNQLIKIFNTSGGNITGTDNGSGNDLTLNVQAGSTTIDGDATTNSDHEKKFFGVAVASGSSLILNKGLMVRYGTFSVSGTLQINSNSYIQSGVANNKAASYSGNAAALIYANGGDYTSTDYEWPVTNAPNNITVQNTGTNVILNNSKTINGTLSLNNARITTGGNTLSLGNAAIVSRTSGWVNGNLQRSFTIGTNLSLPFDIGSSSNYLPTNITLGSVTVAGSITLSSIAAQHPNYASAGLNSSKYLNRYWTAAVSGASFTNAQTQFNYLNSDLLNGASELNLKAARYTGSSWSYPTLGGVSAYSFTVSGLTNSTFGQSFTAGECASIVLPNPNSNSPVCRNSTLTLNGTAVSSGAVGTVSYNWVGVNSFSANTLSASINNVTNAAAGSYTLTATDGLGCTANKSINVSVLSTSSSTTNAAICNGTSFIFNGTSYNTAGSYNRTLVNAAGCDSVATLILTVKLTSSSTTNESICPAALPYVWNGTSYNAAGTYNNTLINAVGCDSVATLVLTVKSTSSSTTNASTCPTALPYIWNGNSFNTTGSYIVNLTNAAGCDSLATLVLTVKTVSTSTINITVCIATLPYVWNGTNYNASGTYNKNFTNAVGCDSVATLVLNVVNTLPVISGSSSVCVGSSIQLNNIVINGTWSNVGGRATVNNVGLVTATSAGTATIKYSIVGCSSVTKTITVNPIPAVPSIAYGTGNTVNPQTAGGFCTNRTFNIIGIPSGGVWSKTGVINVTNLGVVTTGNTPGLGTLKYTFTNANGCVNSRTRSANVLTCASRGVMNNEPLAVSNNDFKMYPNPARTFVSLNVNTLIGAGSIVITDLYGKTVKMQPLSMGINTLDVANFAKGFYLVNIITEQGKKIQKLIIE